MHTHACECQLRPEDDIMSPEAGVVGICELLDVGAGDLILVPKKIILNHRIISLALK